METITLEAQKRTVLGKATAALRRAGTIPAVIYGKGQEPISIQVPENAFVKMYRVAGESTLVDLVIDGAKHKVLVQSVDRDPMTDRIVHADFHKVSLTEKLHAKIPLVYVGESKAVKELGGMLVKSVGELDVECLPQDLVHEIPVDITLLVNFGDTIHLSQVALPPGITVKNLHAEDVVASVAEPRSEAELAALEEKPVESVENVEVVEKKKAEEEEAPAETPEKK